MKAAKLEALLGAFLLVAGVSLAYGQATNPNSSENQTAPSAPVENGAGPSQDSAAPVENSASPSQDSARPSRDSANRDTQSDLNRLHTLPSGTVIDVRIADEVNSSKDTEGDLITGIVDPSVLVNNRVVIPRGTEAHLRIMKDEKGHVLGGKARVRLELQALVMNQEKVDLDTNIYARQQKPFSAKVKAATRSSAGAGTSAATSTTPEVSAASPVIAIFTAARVDLRPGTRIPFTLAQPFTFEEPATLTP